MEPLTFLLQASTESVTNADAWQRTTFLVTSLGGVLTTLAGAAAYVWKKHADKRFRAEEEGRKAIQRTQEDATKAQRELIDYLKQQVSETKTVTEQNTQSLQTQTLSLQTQTDVLQKMSDKQTDHFEVTKRLHDEITKAVSDPENKCKFRKPSGTRKRATQS